MVLYPEPDTLCEKILGVLRRTTDPLKTAEIHRFLRLSPPISVEAVGRRLKILAARGAVRRADYDHQAAWKAVEAASCDTLSSAE